MKKILFISFVLITFSVAASAQSGSGNRIRNNYMAHSYNDKQITRPEKMQLRKDVVHYKVAQKKAKRDGVITPLERRRIHKLKSETRQDAFRFKHNGRRRVI